MEQAEKCHACVKKGNCSCSIFKPIPLLGRTCGMAYGAKGHGYEIRTLQNGKERKAVKKSVRWGKHFQI